MLYVFIITMIDLSTTKMHHNGFVFEEADVFGNNNATEENVTEPYESTEKPIKPTTPTQTNPSNYFFSILPLSNFN